MSGIPLRLDLEGAVKLGLRFEVSQDLDAFTAANGRIKDRSGLAGIFSPRLLDHQVGDGLWFKIEDARRQVVFIHGYRMVDFLGDDIVRHVQRRMDLYFSEEMGLDPDRSSVKIGDAAGEVGGRCCYHGELWLAPSLRGLGLAGRLLRFGQLLAALLFRPDHFFGITVPATSNQKFAQAIGYEHAKPHCFQARDSEGRLVREEGLFWTSGTGVLARSAIVRRAPTQFAQGLSEALGLTALFYPELVPATLEPPALDIRPEVRETVALGIQ